MSKVMRFVVTQTANQPVTGMRKNTINIWNAGADGSNWNPGKNPTTNLGSVYFSSDLDYLRVARIVTSRDAGMSPAAIGGTSSGSPLNAEYLLFAHGLGYAPLLSGDIEVDGYVQPCAGSPIPIPAGDPSQTGYRWVGFTADATNIYMHARGFKSQAMTVHWTVRLYDETFQVQSSNSNLFYASADELIIDGIGKIRQDRRFVRKKPSGAGQFRFLGQQTAKLSASGGFTLINFSDGNLDLSQNAGGGLPTSSTGGALHVAGVECDITGGSPRGSGFVYDELGIEFSQGDDIVFSTQYAMEVSIQQVTGTLSLPAISGVDPQRGDQFHVVDHPLTFGAPQLPVRGFGQYVNATDFLPASRNFDFSGTVLLQAGAITRGTGNTLVGYRTVSPAIVQREVSPGIFVNVFGIREEYFATSSPAVTLGAVDLKYDFRAVNFVGGI